MAQLHVSNIGPNAGPQNITLADPSRRKLLREIRREFQRLADKADGHFYRITIQRTAAIGADGKLNKEVLGDIASALEDGRHIVQDSEWLDFAEEAVTFREAVLNRHNEKTKFADVYDELAESFIRCVWDVPRLGEDLDLAGWSEGATPLAWDSFLIGIIHEMAKTRRHPFLRCERAHITSMGKPGEHHHFYNVGPEVLLIKRDDRDKIDQMKKIVKAANQIDRLTCGIVRGAAYAIDWLLSSYDIP